FVFQLSEQIKKLLSTADGKCGNQHRCISRGGFFDDALERILRFFSVVETIAISRLHHQIIASRRRLGIANDRLVVFAEIAGEKEPTWVLPALFSVYAHQHLHTTTNLAGT